MDLRTRNAFFAWSIASQGAGRSRNTGCKENFNAESFTWFVLHTAVRCVHNSETIFADVAVCQCDNVRHAMLRKFFSIAEINAFESSRS